MSTRRSVVKWFDAKKGYGFIVHPEGGSDIFVHYSAIETERRFKTLRTGQVVEFELTDGPKGLHAVGVAPVDAADQPPLDGESSDSYPVAPAPERREQAYDNDAGSSGSVHASA